MGISDFGRFSIPFHFNGCVMNLKVTKFSTCDDVIHMIIHKKNLPVSKVTLYAVYEQTSSVERMLAGKSLVYKVYRSWGCEKINFQFHIKSKSAKVSCLGIKRNIGKPSAEGEIDGLFMNHYTKKTEHARTTELEQMRKESIMHHSEPTRYMHSERKLVPVVHGEDSLNKHDSSASGKQIVLARFMYDIASRSTKKLRNKKHLPAREHGDGAERDDLCRRQGDGTDRDDLCRRQGYGAERDDLCRRHSESDNIYIRHNKFQSKHDRCLSFLEQTYIIESDSIDSLSLADYDHVSFYENAASYLDTAFIKTSADSDSDEGIDVTSVDSDFDLDVAFYEELHITNSRKNTSHSKSQHPREYSNILQNNTLEKNLCADKLVKELFGRDNVMSEDEEMDSFMRSRLDSF